MESGMSYVNKKVWDENLNGMLITDCAVRDRNILYLCLRENLPHEKALLLLDHDIKTTLLAIFLDTPNNQYGGAYLTGYNMPRVGVSRAPVAQGLLVARNSSGQITSMGGGKDYPDEHIQKDGWPMTWRIKCINGYAYSVGGQRKIYKRTSIGKWEKFSDLPKSENIETVGFNDMDAFSESDMYAVGGHGDVWHYDGSQWRQMSFPSDVQLATVTCAGDGNVYISGEGGSLWVGQKSTWKSIYKGNSSILWNDALWFENKLWLSSDYQFRIWNGTNLEPVTHEGKAVPMNGHMDAYDGLLAVASSEYVMTFDGKDWRYIVSPYLD
jgi:hypothetical protein